MSDDEGSVDPYRCTELVLEVTPDAAIISNLGTASYALIDIEDRAKNFYMCAAMGSTTPTGLGLASSVDDPVTVLEGDGSLLMSLGVLGTVGRQDPANLTIVVWDNRSFETTGGQTNLSPNVDLAAVASACGLASWDVESTDDFAEVYERAVAYEGASVVVCHVHTIDLADHPPLDYPHAELKHRFRTALGSQ